LCARDLCGADAQARGVFPAAIQRDPLEWIVVELKIALVQSLHVAPCSETLCVGT
jgi:hypothetical protein